MRVLSIGECMVEMAQTGEPNSYTAGFAGDTFNTAWYLKRQKPDWDVDYFTAIGVDQMSLQFVEFASSQGIGMQCVHTVAGKSMGLYVIDIQNGERSFSYWRSDSAARQFAIDPDRLTQSMSDCGLVFFSGISLAILNDVGRENLKSALVRARNSGAIIAFDPNLRPALWHSDVDMKNAVMQGAALADIVLPSLDEEMLHFGDANGVATCTRYASTGATTVVVKNGPGPVYTFHDAEHTTFAPPVRVEPKDTTAAGDSFNAACLSALIDGKDLQSAVMQGSALAGHVIQGSGALVV
jgi:2-dehydro-3-deoxygluconokinase